MSLLINIYKSAIGTISTYVFPVALILYIFYKKSRPVLFINILVTCMMGFTNAICSLKYNVVQALCVMTHIIPLIIVYLFPPSTYYNLGAFVVLLLALLLIYLWPVWIYTLSRRVNALVYMAWFALLVLILEK